jgi:hypothetical protein
MIKKNGKRLRLKVKGKWRRRQEYVKKKVKIYSRRRKVRYGHTIK